MSKGGVIEGRPSKPGCAPHRVGDHRTQGAIIQCLSCGAWFFCARHRGYGGRCRAEAVKWWHLRAQRKISAYLARGDQDGEAE